MARPSTTVQAISDFIAGCKADGVWSKITEAYLMAGVTFGGITVKLKGTGTLTNNNFVSGDYQATGAGAGLTGDGSTKYLDTGLLDSSLSADDKSLGAYSTAGASLTSNLIAARDSAVDLWDIYQASASRVDIRLPLSDASVPGSTSQIIGHFIASRRGVNDVELYENGASVGTDTSTAAATNVGYSYYLFSRNTNGTKTNGTEYDGTLTFAHIGTGLTDTDASNLTNRVETLMDALGCGVIS